MKADAVPLLAIFEKKMRLEVPLFQRQYVWNREHQWEPLWEDIARKFTEYLEGRAEAPVHFLGAMVLDQKQTPTSHVERRQVIDGQQRLTTLQVFISAFRDFCRLQGCAELANECDTFTANRGMMADPTVDKFKVWPTQLDRSQFSDVIEAGSREALEEKHPLVRRKYARKYDPRPRMVEAYIFFHEQLTDFFVGSEEDPPLKADTPIAERLEECFRALKNSLQVVVIDLDQEDDAQVIFETLNARGEPLLPADLLRNYIFLRASRRGESQEELYEKYWSHFDEPFWRVEVRQGRLTRPRSDLFMQHFLASRQTVDIPIKHLFVEYRFWIERSKPFDTVEDQLATLARQGADFRRILEPKSGDAIAGLVRFLEAFDTSTAYPLLLALLDANLSDEEWARISEVIESYLLRRAVCGLTTKNYNRVFLGATRSLRRDGVSAANLAAQLGSGSGDSTGWPSDDAFANAWMTAHIYHRLNNPLVVHALRRLSETFLTSKMEDVTVEGPLSIEHIMPQQWIKHWPLSDGSQGLTWSELIEANPEDERARATRTRDGLVQTIGNLTVLTQPLNSSVSNGSWDEKKPELLTHSLLPINQQLLHVERWDEAAIQERGKALLDRALQLWPRA